MTAITSTHQPPLEQGSTYQLSAPLKGGQTDDRSSHCPTYQRPINVDRSQTPPFHAQIAPTDQRPINVDRSKHHPRTTPTDQSGIDRSSAPFIVAYGRRRGRFAHEFRTTWATQSDGQARATCGLLPYASAATFYGVSFIAAAPDTPRCPNCYPPTR